MKNNVNTFATELHFYLVDVIDNVMRQECKKRGIKNLKVLFSTENPLPQKNVASDLAGENEDSVIKKKSVPGSVSFVPSVAGLMIAGEIIRGLIS